MNETLNQKLLTRTKTAVIFGAIVIGLLFYAKWTNCLFLVLVGIFCTWEFKWLDTAENEFTTEKPGLKFAIDVLIICLIFFPIYFGVLEGTISAYYFTLIVSLLYSILALVNLHLPNKYYNYVKFKKFHLGFYIIYPLFIANALLQNLEMFNHFILKVIVLIWICDSGAYLVGSRIGKTKLFESVSPNKTIEGSLGAGLFTILGGLVISLYFGPTNHMYWIALAVIVWIFGTYGDLVQSKIKRQHGVKDTGNFMPGHGGFLDRFDSFIFVWPFIGVLHLFIQA